MLDVNKNLLWSKEYGGTDGENINYAFNLSNNNILLIGSTQSNDGDLTGNHGEYDIWLLEINTLGEVINSEVYGGSEYEGAKYSMMLSNNRLLILATSNSYNGNVPSTDDNVGSIYWIFTLNVN